MILTNLYPEHIEAHGGFENYKAAKLGLFEYVSKSQRKRLRNWKSLDVSSSRTLEIGNFGNTVPKMAIVNGDSEYAKEFLQFNFDRAILFGRNKKEFPNFQFPTFDSSSRREISNFIVEQPKANATGLHFVLNNIRYDAPMYGEHNVMNILCAVSVCRILKIEWDVIQRAVATLRNAPGRTEFIPEAEQFCFKVIVDYAFEPKAIAALYSVVELLKPKRVIHVFGSTGGGRDVVRRFTVGEYVGKHADICIITDEDPYDDDQKKIIDDVASAVAKTGKVEGNNLFKILDRREAIQRAIQMAEVGDLVLVTGKGSEQAMCVAGGKKIPWDDREVVRKMIMCYK